MTASGRSGAGPFALPHDAAARAVLLGGLALGAVLILVWATLPLPVLLDYIPDDSFYYFQPAAMMARGYIPSFDGVHAGNGFHPLWMLMLVPIFALKSVAANLPVRLALLLAGALYLGAGYMVYKILRRLEVTAWWSACAAATFVLWPWAVVHAVDGEVTPVTLLALAVLIYDFLGLVGGPRASLGRVARFGLVGGVAVLARQDNVLLVALLLALYLTLRREETKWLGAAVAAAVVGVFLVLPLAWSYTYAGRFLPTSAWAVPLMVHARPPRGPHPGWFAAYLRPLVADRGVFFSFTPLGPAILICYAGTLALIAAKRRRVPAATLAAGLVFIVALYTAHASLRGYLRLWHLGAALLINQLVLWFVLYRAVGERRFGRGFAAAAAVALLAWNGYGGYLLSRAPDHPCQREMLAGGRWARAHPGLRLGAFNAGIIGYYGADNVVDLDGNMNVGAFDALRARRLYDYCRRERVDYVVDFGRTVVRDYRPFWPAAALGYIRPYSAALDDPRVAFGGSDYVIYEVASGPGRAETAVRR